MMPFLLMKRAGIALGSNMGDKNSLMVQARDHLLKMSLSVTTNSFTKIKL